MIKSATLTTMLIFPTLFLLSCASYRMQTSKSPYLEELGIRKVYVQRFKNSTFKTGVETLVYNALIKRITANGRVRIVRSREEADAVVRGSVTAAALTPGQGEGANKFRPFDTGPGDIQITTIYDVHLSASFTLSLLVDPVEDMQNDRTFGNPPRRQSEKKRFSEWNTPDNTDEAFPPDPLALEFAEDDVFEELNEGDRRRHKDVWGGAFARSKKIQSGTLLSAQGNTSSLINDSKFTRALSDLADSMMGDLHESMLTYF